MVAEGFDAGIRYDESLENDMVAIPIGPRVQRYAAAASPEYLARRGPPTHPRDLLDHDCIAWRFPNVPRHVWQFERHGETIHVEPRGPLVAGFGGATDLAVQAAIAGCGILYLFEDWLRPALDRGALVPVLEPSWLRFPGPFLYYPGRRYLPAPSAHAWISSRRRPRRYVHDHVTPENDHTSPLHTPKSAPIGLGRDFVQVVL